MNEENQNRRQFLIEELQKWREMDNRWKTIVRAAYKSGITIKVISEKIGRSRRNVIDAKNLGGIGNPNFIQDAGQELDTYSKLNGRRDEIIVELRTLNTTARQLSELVGVSERHIFRICEKARATSD